MDATLDPRFAEPGASKELPLGDCVCPGKPHVNGDVALVRTELGWAEIGSAYGVGRMYRDDGSSYYDEALGDVTGIARFTLSWTLVRQGPKGKPEPRPVTSREIALLDEATFKVLKDHFDPLVEAKGRLPNGSSGPSVDSSLETASPIRKARKT